MATHRILSHVHVSRVSLGILSNLFTFTRPEPDTRSVNRGLAKEKKKKKEVVVAPNVSCPSGCIRSKFL
jgi:hypothetical protein